MNENFNDFGSSKKKRAKKGRLSFYTALSVCLVAVGLAVWSTYDSVNKYLTAEQKPTVSAKTERVDNRVTGITERPTLPTQKPTQAPTEPPEQEQTEPQTEAVTEPSEESTPQTALQAMLSVDKALGYPLENPTVSRPYSEQAVYNETMNDLRAHTGVDFAAKEGEQVVCMLSGIVKEVYKSEMTGYTVVVESEEVSVYYCGLQDEIPVNRGDELNRGDVIGSVGEVPFEAKDESHLHIEVRVAKTPLDPLSVIKSDE